MILCLFVNCFVNDIIVVFIYAKTFFMACDLYYDEHCYLRVSLVVYAMGYLCV